MISITELWCGTEGRSHKIRYEKPREISGIRPVVVWNSTRRCNLKCLHCYNDSYGHPLPFDFAQGRPHPLPSREGEVLNELTTSEARVLIEHLAAFGVPCLLLSGGEPLLRDDLPSILSFAKKAGLPIAISTNGTLIDPVYAALFKISDVRYVGISIDGLAEVNDDFRGVPGTFERACAAFRNLKEAGVSSGLRLTMTRHNLNSLPQIFDFVREYSIERVCFYHLVPIGRGAGIAHMAPMPSEIRAAMDEIISQTEQLHRDSHNTEILTVDNHCDNIYIYLRARDPRFRGDDRRLSSLSPLVIPAKAGISRIRGEDRLRQGSPERILEKIRANGGARLSSGVGIACIDAEGNVHPDQFWTDCTLGNIRERTFRDIWMDDKNETLAMLRERTKHIKGRCSTCKWLDICGGGLRSRAHAVTGDAWASDPGCYLNDEEIV